MMIAGDGPANNMSHFLNTERTDVLLWCSLAEVLANDWDTPNSSVLKSSFESVNQKSIGDHSFVSTGTEHTNLFSGSFWFFSYLPGILKTFFVNLELTGTSHLMSQEFQSSMNWDSPVMRRVFSASWTHSR